MLLLFRFCSANTLEWLITRENGLLRATCVLCCSRALRFDEMRSRHLEISVWWKALTGRVCKSTWCVCDTFDFKADANSIVRQRVSMKLRCCKYFVIRTDPIKTVNNSNFALSDWVGTRVWLSTCDARLNGAVKEFLFLWFSIFTHQSSNKSVLGVNLSIVFAWWKWNKTARNHFRSFAGSMWSISTSHKMEYLCSNFVEK